MGRSRKYTLLEHIDMCYRYILKHTEFEPDEDLYQDIATDYIEKYTAGIGHQQILSNLLSIYRRRFEKIKRQKKLPVPMLCLDTRDAYDIVSDIFLKENIERVLETLTEREADIVYRIYVMGMARNEVSKVWMVCDQRISEIERRAIRKLRHPSCAKLLRDFYC